MGIEQRRAERIGRERLPEELHQLTMVFDTGETSMVEVFDASTLGLGLNTERTPETFEDNVGVLLRNDDESIILLGEVVFVMKQPGGARLGVQFTQTIAVGRYMQLIEAAIGS